MPTQRGRSPLRAVASLVGLAWSLACFAAPPPPAAERPQAPPPRVVVQKREPEPEGRCGAVKRASRTWVGFAKGMTLNDMVPAGHAAAAVVRALDAAVCAMSRGEAVAALLRYRGRLQQLAADGGGGIEVTKVLWQDAGLSHAEVELRNAQPPYAHEWHARMVRQDAGWTISSFADQE